MADALDLGSCAARRVGSSPTFRTKKKRGPKGPLFCFNLALVEVLQGVFDCGPSIHDANATAKILGSSAAESSRCPGPSR